MQVQCMITSHRFFTFIVHHCCEYNFGHTSGCLNSTTELVTWQSDAAKPKKQRNESEAKANQMVDCPLFDWQITKCLLVEQQEEAAP